MYNVIESILLSQQGDASHLTILLVEFKPLLKKYANKLRDSDSYEELQCYFIELVLSIDTAGFLDNPDMYIVSYISKSIYHYYITLSKKEQLLSKTYVLSSLSEQEGLKAEVLNAIQDEYSGLMKYELEKYLTPKEVHVLLMHYIQGLPISTIAIDLECSRQAVNKTKNTALAKLRQTMQS